MKQKEKTENENKTIPYGDRSSGPQQLQRGAHTLVLHLCTTNNNTPQGSTTKDTRNQQTASDSHRSDTTNSKLLQWEQKSTMESYGDIKHQLSNNN